MSWEFLCPDKFFIGTWEPCTPTGRKVEHAYANGTKDTYIEIEYESRFLVFPYKSRRFVRSDRLREVREVV